jgi:integrase
LNLRSGVEFPVVIKRLFKPHYVTWSEQQQIERQSPQFLRNIVRILTKTCLRINKELLSMRKGQVDISNATVWIPDSKMQNGLAEVPLTPISAGAFRNQVALAGPGDWLFPSHRTAGQHYKSAKGIWRAALRKAGVSNFRIYDSARRTLRVSVPAVLRMNGLCNCFGRVTPAYARSIPS